MSVAALIALLALGAVAWIGIAAWRRRRLEEWRRNAPDPAAVSLKLPYGEANGEAAWRDSLRLSTAGNETVSLVFSVEGTDGEQDPVCETFVGSSAGDAATLRSRLKTSFRGAQITACSESPLSRLSRDYLASTAAAPSSSASV